MTRLFWALIEVHPWGGLDLYFDYKMTPPEGRRSHTEFPCISHTLTRKRRLRKHDCIGAIVEYLVPRGPNPLLRFAICLCSLLAESNKKRISFPLYCGKLLVAIAKCPSLGLKASIFPPQSRIKSFSLLSVHLWDDFVQNAFKIVSSRLLLISQL